MSAAYPDQIDRTVADPNLQLAIYTATGRLMAKRKETVGADTLPDYQDLRTHSNRLKKHTIENLDYYLEQVESNVERNGGKVVFCKDGKEVADFVLQLAKQKGAHLIVKSKSMTTEEVDLNERLEENQLEAVETDLGEYIIQLAHERPYHIVAPALHKTRYDVADLFTRKLGVEREVVVEKQTMIARATLREKFLAAEDLQRACPLALDGGGLENTDMLLRIVPAFCSGRARDLTSRQCCHGCAFCARRVTKGNTDAPCFADAGDGHARGQRPGRPLHRRRVSPRTTAKVEHQSSVDRTRQLGHCAVGQRRRELRARTAVAEEQTDHVWRGWCRRRVGHGRSDRGAQ